MRQAKSQIFHPRQNSSGFQLAVPDNINPTWTVILHNHLPQMDGWILGGGDRVPARGPRFGLIVLLCRRWIPQFGFFKCTSAETPIHEQLPL
jgi:hypothetical protein